ncbi:hypothetical protein NXC14_CH03247 [Rhizobium sp. NXC14]|nr:hypothetical protein NXC14_CH03247 [Rhizobium sp. NXC14]
MSRDWEDRVSSFRTACRRQDSTVPRPYRHHRCGNRPDGCGLSPFRLLAHRHRNRTFLCKRGCAHDLRSSLRAGQSGRTDVSNSRRRPQPDRPDLRGGKPSRHRLPFRLSRRQLGGYKLVRSIGRFRDDASGGGIVGVTYEFVERLRVVGFEDHTGRR